VSLEIPAQLNIADEFIARPAREHPQRIAIIGEPAAVAYAEVYAAVQRVARGLLDCGCQPRDRVLIVLPDSLEFIAAFFGTAGIGAIAVPVNPHARRADFEYYLADSGGRFAIVHADAWPEFAPAMPGKALERVILVGDATRAGEAAAECEAEREGRTPAVVCWDQWSPGGRAGAALADGKIFRATSAQDAAFFLYTSGSGGTPKAAVHRHQDMLACSRSFAQGVLGLRADDRTFSVSKLFFAYGLGNGMYFPFGAGASTLLHPERPRPDKIAELVARYRPTVFFSVPTFYAALLREGERGLTLDFSSVRLAVSAGEALPAEVFQRFRERCGLEILDGIGSTEMLHMFLSARPGQARPGTCGWGVPNYAAKIVDESGRAVASGEVGNLLVQGASAFAEYWNRPELTWRTKLGEWVVTGDKFFRDPDGHYHYCGRSDDMLKISGQWVSPGEVENALLGHAAVAEAAVVGVTDSFGLVRVAAYIVARPEADASSELGAEIRQWVRQRVAPYKCPQEIHFIPELPKTATGKIQRFRLRDGTR
jgi:benzoate-CoA ligase family protein